MILLPLICLSYLLGSIPTGVVISRLKGVDIRRQGSGNVGATNVARVVGKLPGLIVLVVDTAKGWIPVVFFAATAARWNPSLDPALIAIVAGVAAVAGHIWNPFLGFKGGKGVATSLGVLWGLCGQLAFWTAGLWLAVFSVTRYVSVASISAAMAAPFLMIFLGLPLSWVLGGIGVSIAIIARHRENILRLLHGQEYRFGRSR
ncbi:MAG: glycerol-3-phosphate 1-O-acyltransferase PlsY [Candidatus Omnitrophica bacterium]|nr:glycerol-3-phosphate 1-O-acyltransferase PlsY [Candidatus Omnitrophota bacterium]